MFNFYALLIGGIVLGLFGIWFFVFCLIQGDFEIDAYVYAIVFIFVGCAFIVGSFFLGYPACKNCGYHSNEAFCSECGHEFDPKITCECGEIYSMDSHPVYCSDCGFELKEEVN